MKRRGAVFPDSRLEVAAGCRAEELVERLRRARIAAGGLDYAVEQTPQGGAVSLRSLSSRLLVSRAAGVWESAAAVWTVRALFFGGIAWIAWQVCAHYCRERAKRNENALPR